MVKERRRKPLRERVADRRAGRDRGASKLSPVMRRNVRFAGLILQVVGLVALAAYVWSLFTGGFAAVNYWMVAGPSLIFAAGRGLQLWLSFNK